MIDIGAVEDAARRLEGVAVHTPLIRNAELDAIAEGTVLLKPECLQRTGSFKIRGAYNLLAQLSAEEAERGAVAWSSGNHAQGVAAAGRLLGIRTAIVMPEDAPRLKRANTRRLGGEIVSYDRYTEDREAIARKLAASRGAVIVPSYDHPDIIAGQGTVGLEIATDAVQLDLPPNQVLICCGGGGLTAGSAVALKAKLPDVRIYTVEPERFDDTARSLAAGRRLSNAREARSICDALLADTPGEITFAINRELVSGGLSVSDAEVQAAMRFAYQQLKLVVEPGGAVALAAVLAKKIDTAGKITAVVISGGNVDVDVYAAAQTATAT